MSLGAQMKVIEVALRANVSHFSAGLGLAATEAKGFGRELTGAGDASKQHLQQLSTGAMVMGGAMVAGFGLAAYASMGFEKELSNLAGVSSATGDELDQFRQQALDAGAATVFSASEAAQAQTELAKAGVSTSDILGGALTGSLNLASAGGLDLARSAEITAQALTIFDLKGSQASHVSDLLAAGANKSAADVDQMAQSLAQGGLMAAQAGMSIEDTVGTLALFSQNALLGSDAGTSLKVMLQRLVPQSNEAKVLMDELGISFYDASGQFIGMQGVAEELKTSLSGLSDEQRNMALNTLFGTDASRAASILMEQGAAGVQTWTGAVNDAGYAAELAAKKNDNLAGDLEQLRGSIETALIQGGTEANGVLRFMVQNTTDMVNAVGSMPGPMAAATMGITGITGAALLGVGAAGSLIPKYREVLEALDGMGPGGERAGRGLQAVSKYGGAAAIAVAGLATAWTMWRSEIDKVVNAGLAQVDKALADTDNLADYRTELENVRRESNSMKADLEGWNVHAPWDMDKKREMTEFADGLANDLAPQMELIIVQSEMLAAATSDSADEILVWLEAQRQAGTTYPSVQAALTAYIEGLATGTVVTGEASAATEVATQALDDFKTAMDEVIGTQLAAFDAETAFAQSLYDLTESLVANGATLDLHTEQGRNNRQALSGAAADAMAHSEAVLEETGSIEAANAVLGWHTVQLLGVMTQMGFTEQQAKDYIAQLGLTPENLNTLVQMQGTEVVKTELDTVNGKMDDVAAGANGNVTVNTSQANTALDALKQKYIDIINGFIFRSPNPAPPYDPRAPRAFGGPAGAYTVGPVNERGPELLQMGSTTMLMMGGRGGSVIPNHDPRTQRALATVGGGQAIHHHAAPVINLAVHVPDYAGNPQAIVDAIKWPMVEAMRDVHNARAGRDN